MLIAHISDTHGTECDVPDADILIHTGDIIPGTGYVRDLIRFNEWMSSLPHKHKFLIPGNHDGIIDSYKNTIKEVMPAVRVLIDELALVDGISIWGTPWSLPFSNWHFMKNEWQLQELYDKIPERVDVIASHGPPYGTCDLVDGMNVGSLALREVTYRVFPKVILCGHIHEGYGKDNINVVPVYNSCILDGNYKPTNTAQLITIQTKG